MRQEPHIGAVLVHDGEPLAAIFLGAGFIHEHHPRVEEAAEPSDLGIDRVRNDVADAAPEIRIGRVLLTGQLLARLHVPQAEFCLEPTGRITRDAPGDEGLCARKLPRLETRRGIEGGPFRKPRFVERREIARALQVLGDDARYLLPEIALAGEIRDGDGHGLELAAGADAELELRLRRNRRDNKREEEAERREDDAIDRAN
ncbi:MAG: hypothetical protein K0S56_4783 [Microvirga sp.]|nr:hypothetical protein [Microvirga sp.]